jgi:hypothetical protein
LIDARRGWESLPSFGSLGRSVHIEDARAPKFMELRVGPTRYTAPGWDVPSDGVVICLLGATVVNGSLRGERADDLHTDHARIGQTPRTRTA